VRTTIFGLGEREGKFPPKIGQTFTRRRVPKERGVDGNNDTLLLKKMCDGCHPRALLMLSWHLIVGSTLICKATFQSSVPTSEPMYY
jgi:hypothetical protein